MRLIHRNRNRARARAPRIAISQAEITADLLYRGGARSTQHAVSAARRGAGR
jgi:hypothetical protein